MRAFYQIMVVVLFLTSSIVYGSEIREYILGDIDNCHYDGTGSVDDVYVDPVLWAYADLGVGPATHFDILNANQDVPFTFLFPLAQGELVIGATLTVGIMATDSLATNDWLVLHPDDGTIHWGGDMSGVYDYIELDWNPISFTNTTVRSVDLSNVAGDNRLSFLQGGQLNIHITDDTAVDYAILKIEVIPEPVTLFLLGLGGLRIAYRKRKQHL